MIQPNTRFAARYLLHRRIGTGGYSEVWLAEDILAGNMPVALKIFAPDKGLDEQGIALFSKEYALVFNLNHPNLLLPKHFDVAGGSPFLVLPYCEAGSAFSKIGSMTEPDLARFMQQAASALAYLHSQDPPIIHQDIKPDNFLMDAEGNFLLADFGISSKIRRTLTRSMGSSSAGTLAYMPPEKFSENKQIIKAGDIFSLGVTLYELLTGELPFGDNGGLTLNIGAQVPNLPEHFHPQLNRLVKQCMQKEPWERPAAEMMMQFAQAYLKTESWIIPEGYSHNISDEKLIHEIENRITVKIPDNADFGTKVEFLSKNTNIELVFVKGGKFIMGCTPEQENDSDIDEKPAHEVMISDFYIGKYEVTQKQWVAIMGINPSHFKAYEDCPVENVSWSDIQEFIHILNEKTGMKYRLPTEAEWEYAARGGGQSLGYKYSGSDIIDEVGWFCDNCNYRTHPVGRKKPNELGLFDMSGNVWEWCADDYHKNYYGALRNGQPWIDNPRGFVRVLRGGSWNNAARNCRVSERDDRFTGFHDYSIGFRLALSP